MATTTPNFGWTVPTSTDLVKDGATAIETLGDGVDASFVGLKGGTTGQILSKTSATDLAFTWIAPPSGAGVTFINKTDFTASNAVNVNSVFSTTYDNYRVMVVGASTTASALTASFKMRVGGADTSSNYNSQRAYFISTTVGAAADPAGTDELYIGDFGTTSNKNSVANLDISSPFLTTPTTFTGVNFSVVNSLVLTGGTQKDSTSFTGLSLLFDQTCTGSVYIYGYAKA
jgi:hypothetical protein